MGCSGSRSTDVVENGTHQGAPQLVTANEEADKQPDKQDDDDEDVLVTVDEAVAYVMQELEMTSERARRLVLSVDTNNDGKVSSVELVVLNERIKEIKDYLAPKFEEQDKGGRGYVSPDAALVILKGELSGMPDSYLRAMVTRFDVDDNGQVDFYEFVEFYAFIKAKRGELEEQFQQLDVDHSGDLDAEELLDTLMRECALTELQARSVVEDFDLNRNGKLDKEEFMNMWIKLFS